MRYLLFLILIIGLSSCSEYQQILKNPDADFKFQKAIEYYEAGECYKALPLFEEQLGIQKITGKGDDAYYYYSKVQYCLKNYYKANYYFKNFAKNYPNSEYAEEAQFLAAMSSYQNSPKYSLDQAETRHSINEFQLFLNRYPESELKDSCNTMIEGMRNKLEFKDYKNAIIYHKTQKYKAATIALQNFIDDYPYSEYKEECMYLIIESHYVFAENSVDEKKIERFDDCINSYLNFVSAFPESTRKKVAAGYYEKSLKYKEENL